MNDVQILKKALANFDVKTMKELKLEDPQSLMKFKNTFYELRMNVLQNEAYELVDKYCDLCLTEETEYHKHFRSVMAKHGLKGLKGVTKEKKSEFFKEVKRTWAAKRDQDN